MEGELVMLVPVLETARLLVRPFTMDDLPAVHQLMDVDLAETELGTAGAMALDARRQWLQWTVLSYDELARLFQPPYGDRAIALRATGEVIGSCGYVPCLAPFGQIPALRAGNEAAAPLYTSEFGLFWAVSPAHRRQGYAIEAGRALIEHAFTRLQLQRIVATTSDDNVASIGVMRKLGLRIERNPQPDPPWFQVVGVLSNPERS